MQAPVLEREEGLALPLPHSAVNNENNNPITIIQLLD